MTHYNTPQFLDGNQMIFGLAPQHLQMELLAEPQFLLQDFSIVDIKN
jgi:hypothetical protein